MALAYTDIVASLLNDLFLPTKLNIIDNVTKVSPSLQLFMNDLALTIRGGENIDKPIIKDDFVSSVKSYTKHQKVAVPDKDPFSRGVYSWSDIILPVPIAQTDIDKLSNPQAVEDAVTAFELIANKSLNTRLAQLIQGAKAAGSLDPFGLKDLFYTGNPSGGNPGGIAVGDFAGWVASVYDTSNSGCTISNIDQYLVSPMKNAGFLGRSLLTTVHVEGKIWRELYGKVQYMGLTPSGEWVAGKSRKDGFLLVEGLPMLADPYVSGTSATADNFCFFIPEENYQLGMLLQLKDGGKIRRRLVPPGAESESWVLKLMLAIQMCTFERRALGVMTILNA